MRARAWSSRPPTLCGRATPPRVLRASPLPWSAAAARPASRPSCPPRETPDGRPGVAILIFAMSSKDLQKHLERRAGQCVLTCPTTAAYGGIPAEAAHDWMGLGRSLRYFGDGFQISSRSAASASGASPSWTASSCARRRLGLVKAIGGGNFLILARGPAGGAAAAERGGGHAEGEERHPAVSRRRSALRLRRSAQVQGAARVDQRRVLPDSGGLTDSRLPAGAGAVLEIVIDGLDADSIQLAARRHPGRLRCRVRSAVWWASRPGTTAASSALITSTSRKSWREAAHLQAQGEAALPGGCRGPAA